MLKICEISEISYTYTIFCFIYSFKNKIITPCYVYRSTKQSVMRPYETMCLRIKIPYINYNMR